MEIKGICPHCHKPVYADENYVRFSNPEDDPNPGEHFAHLSCFIISIVMGVEQAAREVTDEPSSAARSIEAPEE